MLDRTEPITTNGVRPDQFQVNPARPLFAFQEAQLAEFDAKNPQYAPKAVSTEPLNFHRAVAKHRTAQAQRVIDVIGGGRRINSAIELRADPDSLGILAVYNPLEGGTKLPEEHVLFEGCSINGGPTSAVCEGLGAAVIFAETFEQDVRFSVDPDTGSMVHEARPKLDEQADALKSSTDVYPKNAEKPVYNGETAQTKKNKNDHPKTKTRSMKPNQERHSKNLGNYTGWDGNKYYENGRHVGTKELSQRQKRKGRLKRS